MATESFVISRRIELDAGHRVPDHKSKCKAIHGHRYVVEAFLQGPLVPSGEQKGMVMDFGFLKDVMMQEIHAPCDHGLILSSFDTPATLLFGCSNEPYGLVDPKRLDLHAQPLVVPSEFLKIYLLPDSPTAENLARHWFERVHYGIGAWCTEHNVTLPEDTKLQKVRVYETPNCYADYPA